MPNMEKNQDFSDFTYILTKMKISEVFFFDFNRLILTRTIIAILLALWIYWLWGRRKFYALSMKMPGPFAYPIIGNALDIGIPENGLGVVEFFMKMAIKYKNNFRLWFGPEFVLALCDSEDFETLLTSKVSINKDRRYEMFKLTADDGLLISSGDFWKKHRLLINPSFNMATLRSYQPIYNLNSKRLIESLEKLCLKGTVDPSMHFKRYIADVMTEAVFGVSFEYYNGEMDYTIEISSKVVGNTVLRMTRFWLEWDIIYKLTEDCKYADSYINEYRSIFHGRLKEKLEEYIEKNKDSGDAIEEDLNLKKVRNTFEILANAVMNGQMTEKELYGEFDNIFNPGLETSYSSLCMFIMMLAMHNGPQQKLIKEIDDFYGDDEDSDVTQEDFKNLPYLDMCLKEVTRLYPTGPLLFRHLLEDIEFKSKNQIIPAGTTIFFSLFVLHRDPKYWNNPNSFEPERFSKENSKDRPQFAYIPFLAGPRNCIGRKVAIDSVKTAVINVLRKFEFHSDLKIDELKLMADVSVRSGMGYNMTVTRRQKNKSRI